MFTQPTFHTAQVSLEAFYRRVFWESSRSVTKYGEGWTLSYSGIRYLHSVNHLWLHRHEVLTKQLVDEAAKFFAQWDADYSIVFLDPESTPEDAFDQCSTFEMESKNYAGYSDLDTLSNRFRPKQETSNSHDDPSHVYTRPNWLISSPFSERSTSPVYAMVGDPTRLLNPTQDERGTTKSALRLRIEQATLSHRTKMIDLLGRTFYMTDEAGARSIEANQFDDPHDQDGESRLFHYLAYSGDALAGCGSLLLSQGVAGLWNIGTLRPFRRQGIASAMVFHLMQTASSMGVHTYALMSSPMGKSLYEGLGYKQVATMCFYTPAD